MQKGQIARQWCTLVRSGARWGDAIKGKKVKMLGSGARGKQ